MKNFKNSKLSLKNDKLVGGFESLTEEQSFKIKGGTGKKTIEGANDQCINEVQCNSDNTGCTNKSQCY